MVSETNRGASRNADPQRPLRFSSSASRPLAWIAGRPIGVGRFRTDVERLASRLQGDEGVAAGDGPIGNTLISCSGRYAFSVALLASWLSGRTALLPPNSMAQTLSDLRDREAVGFECDDAWARQLSATANDADIDAGGSHGHWQPLLRTNGPAVSLFTSGSTGIPKRISKSLANLLDEAHTLADSFDWPDGPILAGVPAQHLYGLTFSLLLPWVLGRPWVDDMPRYPRDVLAALKRNRATTLISVPAHYQALLQDGGQLSDGLGDLHCVSAAASLSEQLARQWQQRHGRDILEIYGSTETGVVAWRRQRLASSWQALPAVRLSRQQGLLKVASPFVSEPFADGFVTADRVSAPRQGRFELLGRSDAIVKIAGKRVSLTRIEDQLRACAGVAEAAVIAVPATGVVRDLAIWAAVVGDREHPLPPGQLRSQLRSQLLDRLDGIEIPRRVLVVDALPRSASGKLPRRAIAALFNEHDHARVSV